MGNGDSIYINIKNPTTDRILIYDKNYFVRIAHQPVGDDTFLVVIYGNFSFINDSLCFTYPDSNIDTSNRFFCYCKSEMDGKVKFQIRNTKRNHNNLSALDDVYYYIFKKKKPNLPEMEEIISAKSAKTGKASELYFLGEKYRLLN